MKCSFCGKTTPRGRGKMLVKNSGQILYFCDAKCDRNYGMGRDGRKIKWTETSRKLRSEKALVKETKKPKAEKSAKS